VAGAMCLDVFIAPAAPEILQQHATALVSTPATSLRGSYICRAAVLDALRPYAWTSLMPAQPWQAAACAAPTSPLISPIPTLASRRTPPPTNLLCPL